jgi:hypothetical protein
VISNRKLGLFGDSPMLDDDVLLTIAENLARLKLSPLLHLKIAVAVVAPLITPTSEASTSTAQGEKAVEPTRSKESRRTAKAPKGQIRRADGTFAATGNGAAEGKRETPTRRWYHNDPTQNVSDKTPEAVAFLREALAGGARSATDIDEMAEKRGVSPNALGRAKNDLGITAKRLDRGAGQLVYLSLPQHRLEEAET